MATRTHSSPKADFILGLPSSLSVAQVVERAAAQGMTLSGSMVRKTRAARAIRRPSGTTGKRPTERSATDKASGTARPGSKRAFVLSFPPDTAAGEIVAAAKAKGQDLPAGYVYWVRSDVARKARAGGSQATSSAHGSTERRRPGRPPASRDARGANASASASSPRLAGPLGHHEAEGLLIQTALRVVGIERAIELLKAARERIDRLLD